MEVPYGIERNDTLETCGDANNGFSLSLNYNTLGEGSHTAQVFDDGELFATVEFDVVTLGEEFLTGVYGSSVIEMSAGQLVSVLWSEQTQGFTILASYPGLEPLLGTWQFSYTFDEPVADTFTLDQIDLSGFIPLVSGKDESGSRVTAQPWKRDPLARRPYTLFRVDANSPNEEPEVCQFNPEDLEEIPDYDFALFDDQRIFLFTLDTTNTLSGSLFETSEPAFLAGAVLYCSLTLTEEASLPFHGARVEATSD